ncbi:hypothetical protein GCM10010403_36680 [Glycomyces rutgersensis]|uniref:Uncharacterized protein n=1 Tax=Glycomyces rutgersensis TaxID=58115 RepID=A0ABP5SWY2_9ACTN
MEEVRAHDLEGHQLSVPGGGEEDAAHAALAELGEDPVRPDLPRFVIAEWLHATAPVVGGSQ